MLWCVLLLTSNRFRQLCIAWIVDLVELANDPENENKMVGNIDFDSMVEAMLPLCKFQAFR